MTKSSRKDFVTPKERLNRRITDKLKWVDWLSIIVIIFALGVINNV